MKIQLNNLNTVLCLGAHSDDIEIGCGGTILRLLAENPNLTIFWVVLSATGKRADEAVSGANSFLESAPKKEIVIQGFRDSYFPYVGGEIKEYLHEFASGISPDLILTHRGNDAHQDHRLVSELTWCVFRNGLILEYEVPKYEADLTQPNFFVPLEESIANKKMEFLANCFKTQKAKRWFCKETFGSLMRIRGNECNSASGLAEAFHCRKLVL